MTMFTAKKIGPQTNPIEGDRLDYDEVVERYKTYLKMALQALCQYYECNPFYAR